MRRARDDGVRTILTGQGGDEWLTITPYLSADLIRHAAFSELAHLYRSSYRSYQFGAFKLAHHLFWTYGIRPLAGAVANRFMPEANHARRLRRLLADEPAWVTPDSDLRTAQRCRAEAALTCADPPQGFYMRELEAGLDHTLTSWDAEERYQLEQWTSVRVLHPFWDPDVVELLCRTPPRVLNKGDRSKGLVRGALARRFPDLGLERQRKVAATSFLKSVLLREGHRLADAAGDFPALSALGIVDGRATRAFIRGELRQPSRQLYRILQAIRVEMWVRSRV
jgi:hypothetical protein